MEDNDFLIIIGALDKISASLNKLGLNDAETTMGAIELLSKEVKEGSILIAKGLHSIAHNIKYK